MLTNPAKKQPNNVKGSYRLISSLLPIILTIGRAAKIVIAPADPARKLTIVVFTG